MIDAPENKMPLIVHMTELRNRLIYCVVFFTLAFGLCFYFSQDIYAFLVHPLAELIGQQQGRKMIYTGLTEAFFTYMDISLFAAFCLSFPFIINQLWLFIAPGLYHKEKRLLLPFLIATPTLFVVGAALAYFFVIPNIWQFFLSFESSGGAGGLPIQLEARVSEYLSLVVNLIVAFGLSFQLPVGFALLAHIGIIKTEQLKKLRRFAYVAILIVAAMIAPPDVASQLMLGIPLILLFEISILVVRFIERRKAKAEAALH